MLRKILIAAAVMAISTTCYAQNEDENKNEDATFKSDQVRIAQKAYKAKMEEAQKEYDKKSDIARKIYVGTLEIVMKETTKKGDLDEANKIKEEKESITKEITKEENHEMKSCLVLVNQSSSHECGADIINIILYNDTAKIWIKNNIKLNWAPDNNPSTFINLPDKKFTKIHIDILKWHGFAGGLSEIKYFQSNKLISLNTATASGKYQYNMTPEMTIDGDDTSYWMLPQNKAGWIEVRLNKKF